MVDLKIIGLMSGTSLDGLDICYTRFLKSHETPWQFEILQTETIQYPDFWLNRLKKAIELPTVELLQLNTDFGYYLGKTTQSFIQKNNIKNLDLVASHGHTVHHRPDLKFTLQIGDGRALATKLNCPVIYDFRSQDVLLGGQGAPLVPIGDALLFPQYDACLNIGGFSNISFEQKNKRIAFDICPVNTVLNFFSQQLGYLFDENGNLARQAKIIQPIVDQLNNLVFYTQKPPKSLGIEWVNEQIFPLFTNIHPQEALATFTEHAAFQISKMFKENQLKNVLITGGGAYNQFLIERIKYLSTTEIQLPNSKLIEYKEALVFAFLGALRFVGQDNVLASVTGAFKNHCSGLLVCKI